MFKSLMLSFIFTATGGFDISCKECETYPIFGTKYHCKICPHPYYNMCQKCKKSGKKHEHRLKAIPEDPLTFLDPWHDSSEYNCNHKYVECSISFPK